MKQISFLLVGWFLWTVSASAASAPGESRDAKVLNDRTYVIGSGLWVYNDLDKGIAESRRTGKPLLVTFRCVP